MRDTLEDGERGGGSRAKGAGLATLVVFCHPSPDSYSAALCATACGALSEAGHEVRLRDLYAEGFDPVLSRQEWEDYLSCPENNIRRGADHVADLLWAEALVVIYPTWYFGPPAMLKGWLERIWLPGVTFEIAPSRLRRPKPLLRRVRLFVGITTSGSPWWWLRLVRDPGRSLWTRALRPVFAPGCRMRWCQLHDMNHTSDAERAAFLRKVEKTLRGL
jgi:putative NADPH-quinone reductase